MTTIKAINLDEVTGRLDEISVALETTVWTEGMQDGIDLEVEQIKERTPKWQGLLEESIQGLVELVPGGARAAVGPTVDYGPYVEFETVRHFVPARYIGEWAADHGFGYTGLIVSGKALPFMRKNASETLLQAGQRIRETAIGTIENFLVDLLR